MQALVARLRLALVRFETCLGQDITSQDRELIRSTAVALEAVAGKVTLPRHHVVQTIRTIVGQIEESWLPLEQVEEARAAYGDLCEAWGFLLVDGQPSGASVTGPAHAVALAGHLATLIEFHHDDDGDEQHADPILEAYHPPELSSLRLKTQSGRQFMVSVVELPA